MSFGSPFSFVPLWLFVFLLSTATALMEIQIEGGNGWAELLPSWHYAPPWLKAFLNGKDLTGYHVYLNLHSIIFLHFPIILMGWSWMMELTILFVFGSCIVCEDFLWFVLNPHFGWHSFRAGKIYWYTHWFGPLPTDYYFWIILSLVTALLRGTIAGATTDPSLGALPSPLQQLIGWALGLLICVLCIIIIILLVTPRITRFLATDTAPHPGHPKSRETLPEKIL